MGHLSTGYPTQPRHRVRSLGSAREKGVEMGGGHPSLGGRLLRRVVEGERDTDVWKIVNKDSISQF